MRVGLGLAERLASLKLAYRLNAFGFFRKKARAISKKPKSKLVAVQASSISKNYCYYNYNYYSNSILLLPYTLSY